MIDERTYLPQIAWRSYQKDVQLLSDISDYPAQYSVIVSAIDVNEPGAATEEKEVDFWLKDFVGHTYRITQINVEGNPKKIKVEDFLNCGSGPQSGQQGIIYKSSGNGVSPYLAPVYYRHLDKSALEYSRQIELDILWKEPSETNVKWHPDGLIFSVDKDNPNLITYTDGTITHHLWSILSDYKSENVIGLSSYHPEKSWSVTGATVELATNDTYHIYIKIPILESASTAELVFIADYRHEDYYSGYVNVLIGICNVPNPHRTISLLWSNYSEINHAALSNLTWNTSGHTGEIGKLAGFDESGAAVYYDIPTGSDVIAGDGMDFTTNAPVTLGLPSTITSETINEVTETSHTHELGNVGLDKVIDGSPVEYGALYNFPAATDTKKISSSDDWVVPSADEWLDLANTLGAEGQYSASVGGKLKETGTVHWYTPNVGATNEVNFNARGSGSRKADGTFDGLTLLGLFWSRDEFNATYSRIMELTSSTDQLHVYSYVQVKEYGLAIRLLYTGLGTPTSYTGNDGKVYKCVQIGTQVWLAENLNETKYRNGDYIHGFEGGTYTPISNAEWAALTSEAMCYYSDNEANGGGETPLSYILESLQAPTSTVTRKYRQVPSGVIDSVNDIYTIPELVVEGSEEVFRNGQLIDGTESYSITYGATTTIVLTTPLEMASDTAPTEKLLINYSI